MILPALAPPLFVATTQHLPNLFPTPARQQCEACIISSIAPMPRYDDHEEEQHEELERLVDNDSAQPLLDDDNHPASSSPTDLLDLESLIARYNLSDHRDDFFEAVTTLSQDSVPSNKNKFHLPVPLTLIILVVALGAASQGWTQTGINGANLYFPRLFGIGSDSPRDTLILGIINAGIYLSNAIFGSFLVAPVNDRFGRRGAIFIGSVISFVANTAGSVAQSWLVLLICRLILGVGLALVSSSANVYAAECAPKEIRGGLGVVWQMFCAFGIFVGFAVNWWVDQSPEAFGPMRWRVMLAAAALPSLPLMGLVWFCPESPAWFVKHGERYEKAFDSLCRIKHKKVEAARELLMVFQQNEQSSKVEENPHRSLSRSLMELFSVPRIRRATVAAYTAMLAQQACGINIIAFFSSNIFVRANFSPYAAELASTIFGLCNFLGAFPAVWTMDSLGRRSLMLYTLPPMALTLAIAAIGFSLADAQRKVSFYLTTSMIYLFCLLYSPGMGPAPTAYSAEVFPLSHRELASSSAVAVTNFFAAVLSLTFPYLLAKLGTAGSFLLYAVLNVVAWVLVFLLVPETKKQSLEGLDEVFSVPTRRFAKYQIKRYLLRQDVKKPGLAGVGLVER
ncbi:Arabinose-proton symporter [Cercospora beticola]|uniref:Arabinose-proton symporter n=1 Tax=Cercospora beticola TaxID=122368 RepID=A0A2G5HLF4_CERBT|nr:Arabinose-proton symporter [Cercospora beticola]PIA93360.1 Arabinose-proton symporter [Cercospora beticola]WPB01687.1 hypothetical protein RHO25_006317 [Cercospora beticola]